MTRQIGISAELVSVSGFNGLGTSLKAVPVKRALLLGSALVAGVLASMVMSTTKSLANNECGSQAGGAPIVCGPGPFSGITYSAADTSGAVSITFNSTQNTSNASGTLVITNATGESILATMQTLGGPAPLMQGPYSLQTSGAAAPITFNMLTGIISNFSTGSAITGVATVTGANMTTGGSGSPIMFNQSVGANIIAGATPGNGLIGLASAATVTGLNMGTSGAASGVTYNQAGDVTATATSVGATISSTAFANGVNVHTSGATSPIIYNQSGSTVTATATAGAAPLSVAGAIGIGMNTTAVDSSITYTQLSGSTVNATATGGATANLAVGVVMTSIGAPVTANLTGTTNATSAFAGNGTGIGALAQQSGGAGLAQINLNAGGVVNASGGGLFSHVTGAGSTGNAEVNVSGNINQTGTAALPIAAPTGPLSVAVGLPVGFGAAAMTDGSGNATVNTSGSPIVTMAATTSVGLFAMTSGAGTAGALGTAGSTLNMNGGGMSIGSLALATGAGNADASVGTVNFGANGFAGALGIATGNGNATATAHGDILSGGNTVTIGLGAIAGGTGNATTTNDAGMSIDPVLIGMVSVAGAGQALVNNNGSVETTVVGLLGVDVGTGSVLINNTGSGVTDPTTGNVLADTGIGILGLKIGATGATDPAIVVNNTNVAVVNALAGPGVVVIGLGGAAAPVNAQVNNDGASQIVGLGGGVLSASVLGLTDGTMTINNTNGSTIDNFTGIGAGNFTGLSVFTVSGGDNILNNTTSTVNGDVFMLAVGAGANATVNNSAGATWQSEGVNVIAALGANTGANANATINNDTGALVFNSAPTLTVLASVNGNATLNNGVTDNTGRIQIGSSTAPTIAAYLFVAPNGVESVNNAANNFNSNGFCENLNGICVNGVGVFSGTATGLEFNNAGGNLSMINGISNYGLVTIPGFNTGLGDLTIINGNFNGDAVGRGSQLGLDAFLSGPTNSSSDLMLVTNGGVAGQVTGTTGLVVANGNNPGQYNPVGIPVVAVASGLTTLNNFFIDPQSNNYAVKNGIGVVDKGFFFYAHELVPSMNLPAPALTHVLVGLPDEEAFQLAYAIAGAQNIWYETANNWTDKQNDLRNSWGNRGGAGADLPTKARRKVDLAPSSGAAVWLKAMGSWTSRNANQTPGFGFSFDTSYKQDTYGLLGGIDWTTRTPTSIAQVGIMGGYVDSRLTFNQSPTNFKYHGGLFGVTGTYINNGWFIDGLFKADLLTLDLNFPSVAQFGVSGSGVDVTNLGVMGNAGYRFGYGKSYVEPVATVAYVSTKIDSTSIQGLGINFNDGKSFRAGAGARAGTVLGMWGTSVVDGSLTAKVWNEFEANNSAVLSSLGPALTVSDGALHNKPFGEVVGLIDVGNNGAGWSGFVNAGVKFNNEFTTVQAKAGTRYQW